MCRGSYSKQRGLRKGMASILDALPKVSIVFKTFVSCSTVRVALHSITNTSRADRIRLVRPSGALRKSHGSDHPGAA